MRTKTMLLTAAIVAAGVASSKAQSNVYSLNIVGYVNVPLVAAPSANGGSGNFYMLANPFDDGAGDHINSILSSATNASLDFDGSSVWTYSPTGYSPSGYSYASTNWSPDLILTPGKGFWLQFAGNLSTNVTVTFVGSVVLNSTNTLTGDGSDIIFSLVGSAYPASTNLVGLGMNWLANADGINEDGDGLYRWDPVGQAFLNPYAFNYNIGWSGPTGDTNGPVLNVAEGFFYENGGNNTSTWIQSFTVN